MINNKYSVITTNKITDIKNNLKLFSVYLFGLPIFTIRNTFVP